MIDIRGLDIPSFKEDSNWDFSNQILYDLCETNFAHVQEKVILTKVLFIGRIYAAAIERRRNNDVNIGNDDFYIHVVAPTFKNSNLDKLLIDLRDTKKLASDNLSNVLRAHHYLMNTLFKITNMNKRSFCSKYLHFHLPELFFIYDTRAVDALRKFTSRVPRELSEILKGETIDIEYATFFCKCFNLKTEIENHYNTRISNRQLDNILMDVANNSTKYY